MLQVATADVLEEFRNFALGVFAIDWLVLGPHEKLLHVALHIIVEAQFVHCVIDSLYELIHSYNDGWFSCYYVSDILPDSLQNFSYVNASKNLKHREVRRETFYYI